MLLPYERHNNELTMLMKDLDYRTAEDLARALGVHRNTANSYISGKYPEIAIMALKYLKYRIGHE